MEIPKFVLGNFDLDLDDIIQGGEANIFIGSHSSHGKVAVKKWNKNYCDMNKERVLTREIKILMENPHEYIIEVIGLLIDKESKCIGYVMPYMTIGSLEDGQIDFVIHNKGKSYDDIYTHEQKTTWITQICRGLSHLHLNNIIHRDIKPSKFVYILYDFKFESILLGESYDNVKLSDFGIARSVANITHSLTTNVGTELYVALEIFKGEDYTFSADIYSFSITIWEIVHRRTPYDHIEYPSFAELYQMIIFIGTRPQLKNDLPKEVSNLLKSCWDANVSKRPTIDKVLEFFENTTFSLPTSPVEKFSESFDTQSLIGKSSEKQTILLVGGSNRTDGDSLLLLENDEQNWKELNIKLPYGVRGHGAQFLNNNLYIFGGQNEKLDNLSWTYKLSKSLKWKKMTDMNRNRFFISNSSVILNNQIWVCGGGGDLDKSVEIDMNKSRTSAAAAVVNGKIFCSGGWNEDSLNSVECYDPSSDVWTLICNMSQMIWGHGAAEIDGDLIVMGGWIRRKGHSNSVWALNTTDEDAKWIAKPSVSISRRWFSIAKIDGKVFLCGGEARDDNKHTDIDNVEIFDRKVWRNGPKMPTPRRYAPAVIIPMSFARYLK